MELVQALSPEHFEEIVVESAVDPAVAEARGYRTITGTGPERDELRTLGYKPGLVDNDATYPALLIPMHNSAGEQVGVQIKPRVPRVRHKADGTPVPVKYESPAGAALVVDVPQFTRDKLRAEGNASLWITEGMKKVDSLVSRELAAVGLTGVFNWRNKLGTLGDWEDIPIKGRPVVLCFDADANGNRNVQLAMARLGAWVKTRGASVVHYLVVPSSVGETPTKGVDDYFAAGGEVAGLKDAATTVPPGGGQADAAFTDAYLVEEVCTGALDGKFCWASGLGWMKWDGRIWREVADTEPVEAVRQWALAQFEAVLSEQKRDPARNMSGQVNGWRQVLGKARLRALTDLARGIIERYADEFDGDPDLLTVRNGTVHLPTGKLLPFDPAHSITKMAGAPYVPGAQHATWDKALTALPAALHPWYQDRIGQALTGYKTPDHLLVISYGGGSNGKSVVTKILRKVAGDYGVMISDRVLMASPDAHPTEMMDLRGARYAVLEETPEARHLNTQRLKTTLGTDHIKARRIRQDPVEFLATHSLFINTNYRPVVNETDHGTWRRLALLTYPYTFRKRPSDVTGPLDRLGDPALEYADQDPAVITAALAWMVEGARAWYARGRRMLEVPEGVEKDTAEWRAETDLVMGFAGECLRLDPEAFTPAADLLSAFNVWSADRGHRPWNDKTFGSRFGAHDVIRGAKVAQGRKYVGGRQLRGWHGVAVLKPGEDGGDPFSDETAPPEPPAPRPPAVETPPAPRPPVVLGFDIETADADRLFVGGHDGSFVRLVGTTSGGTTPTTDASLLVDALNCADVIYGHKVLAFDLVALAHHHGADYDALAAKTVDTHVLAQLIDPPGAKGMKPWGVKGYYSLDAVAKRLGHQGKSDDLKALADEFGGYDQIPTDDPRYHSYLHGDLEATRHVYEQTRTLHAPGASSPDERTICYAEREMRVVAIQNRMTLNGWAVDAELLAQRIREETERRESAVASLRDEFGMPTERVGYKLKPKAEWSKIVPNATAIQLRAELAKDPEHVVRLGIATVVRTPMKAPWATAEGKIALERAFNDAGAEFVPRSKTGELALNKDALGSGFWLDAAGKARPGMLRVYGHLPKVVRLVELIGLATGASAKYAEVEKYVTPAGRVHGPIGKVQASGRWSQSPWTTMGKRGDKAEERRVAVADPGHVLLTCDLSQVDMRAVAAHCQDPEYMQLFAPGRDAHMEMAQVYFGERTKQARHRTKAINHGLNYGESVRRVAESNQLDQALVQAAADARAAAYPRLIEWTNEVRAIGESGQLLDNGFGRLMRCDPARAYTQAPALMGQGAARDIMAESLLRLMDLSQGRVSPYLRGVVHDEVVLSVPEDEAEHWTGMLREAFTWEWRGVPILCEVSAPGRSWADCSD